RAHALWKDYDVPRARDLLEECPTELRGWEWNYVQHLCDDGLLRVGVESILRERYVETLAQCGVAFSPDGRLLASAGRYQVTDFVKDIRSTAPLKWSIQNEVLVLDIRTGRQAMQLQGVTDVRGGNLAFSPDGKLLAVGGAGKVWGVATGKVVYD